MPRPRINPDAHRKNIALTLPPKLIERAKTVCEIGGWSVSSVVEDALTNYLNALDREIGRKCSELSSPNVRCALTGAIEKKMK